MWKNNILNMQRQFGKQEFIFSLFMDAPKQSKSNMSLLESDSLSDSYEAAAIRKNS